MTENETASGADVFLEDPPFGAELPQPILETNQRVPLNLCSSSSRGGDEIILSRTGGRTDFEVTAGIFCNIISASFRFRKKEGMSKAGFSIADLQQGAKKLNNVQVNESKNTYTGTDPETLKALGTF